MAQDFVNSFIEKLTSKTTTVAINISSSSTIEVMEIDKNGVINNYVSSAIQYNAFTKELENVAQFESEIKKAFADLGVSTSSPVYVSLPTFVIDHEEFPAIALEEDAENIKTMLKATVEKNYIFKKYDPAISFYKLPTEESLTGNTMIPLCYTALRADEYAKIKGVFDSLRLNVKAIDSSYSALINGVIATQKINPEIINADRQWNIINITSNSFVIFAMKGKHLYAVYEEPLAVKSFNEDEIYQIVTNSLDLVIHNYPADQVVIVSQSDNVSAEYLSSVLDLNCSKAFIEDNRYRKPLVETGLNITQSSKSKISLEAVGITTWNKNSNGFKFNFLDTPSMGAEASAEVETIFVNINGKEVELSYDLIKKVAIGFMGLVFIIFGGIYAGLLSMKNAFEVQETEIAEKIGRINKELDIKHEVTGISEAEFLGKSYRNNLSYLKSYAAIAKEIPDMLWIEELQLSENSTLYLKGRSYRMDDILNYYDSLKNIGAFQDLRISTLKISNTPISDLLLDRNSEMTEETTYEFAIGQPFFVNLNAPTDSTEKKDGSSNNSLPLEGVTAPPTIPKQDI